MRISDWSSDVCSSDLRGRNSGSRDAAVLRRSVMLSPFHVAGGSLGGAALRLLQVGPVEREDRLDNGIIHITEPRDRPHQADIDASVLDISIVDMDADNLAQIGRAHV